MRLRNVTFDAWLRSHSGKAPEERWLRELYPWPVLAQVDCDEKHLQCTQRIKHDGVNYEVTLESICWQPQHGTFRYRIFVESEGLGWHSRSFSDHFNMCGAQDGRFVTLFHTKKKEPLEKITSALFRRDWNKLGNLPFENLAVSRYLAASIVSQIVNEAFSGSALEHYPRSRLVGGTVPMFGDGSNLWIGYRFSSEGAFEWARKSSKSASKVIAFYFADTKHQFNTDLPPNAEVWSIYLFDAKKLSGQHEDLIRFIQRGNDLPKNIADVKVMESIVTGKESAPPSSITEKDVNEALAAIKLPYNDKSTFRYQLAAAVVLNTWIEQERALGFGSRKKFYAFKQQVGTLVEWAVAAKIPGVVVWADAQTKDAILYIRIDDVDFSFRAIPDANKFFVPGNQAPTWRRVRLKPISSIVLAWARELRQMQTSEAPGHP